MKQFLRNAYRIGVKNGWSMVLFEIFYRAGVTALIFWITELLIRFSLRQQGFSYLTAENYTKFIKNPITILFAVGVLILLAFFVLVEVCAVFWAVSCSIQNRKTGILEMVVHGFSEGIQFTRYHPIFWPLYLLGTMPFLCLHFIIWEIANINILEFTALQIYKMFPNDLTCVVTSLVILSISVIITFSLPYSVVEKKSIRKSFRKAARLLRRRLPRCIAGVLLMQLLVFGITALIYGCMLLVLAAGVWLFVRPAWRISAILNYGMVMRRHIALYAGSIGVLLGLTGICSVYFPRRGFKYMEVWKHKKAPRITIRKPQWLKRRQVVRVITVVLMAVEASAFVGTSILGKTISYDVQGSFAVTAHRGGASMAPENTMSAMEYAVESMSDYAEIDVQETKDDVLVLLHDNNLKRTTGFKGNIWDMTYAEVSRLDAGVKFNQRFVGEKVPTLDEVLEYSQGKIRLNIEVKSNGHNQNIVSKVVECLEEHNFVQQCVLTSMDYSFLEQAKKLNPDIRTGYIMTMTYGSIRNIDAADLFSVRHTYVTRRFVEEAHSEGKEVHAWTTNYPGDIQRMITYGVDGVITDKPALVHKIYLGEGGIRTDFWQLIRYALK